MAKKTKEFGSWRGFFNYYLSDAEKAGIRTLADDKKRRPTFEYLNELVENHFKVSATQNESAGVYLCSITGQKGNLNEGYTYSISHVDLELAVLAVWFVASEVYEWGEWPTETDSMPDW